MARQVFTKGQRVWYCVSKESRYGPASWVPATVVEPQAIMCPVGNRWHNCRDSCVRVPTVTHVHIKLEKSDATSRPRLVRNMRNVIVDDETGQQLSMDSTVRRLAQDRRRHINQLQRKATSHLEGLAVDMAKGIKRATVLLNQERDNEAYRVLNTILGQFRLPKPKERRYD